MKRKDTSNEDSLFCSGKYDDRKNKLLPFKERDHTREKKFLKRFLESKIGINWNLIYSDICNIFNKKTFIGQISISDANKIVERNPYIENGKVFHVRWGRHVELNNHELYVDLKDNTLRKYTKSKIRRKYKSEKINKIYFNDDPQICLRKEKEIWFLFDYNNGKSYYKTVGFSIRHSMLRGVVKELHGYEQHSPFKRQLNGKELFRLKKILIEAEEIFLPRKMDCEYYLYVNTLNSIIGTAKKGEKKR